MTRPLPTRRLSKAWARFNIERACANGAGPRVLERVEKRLERVSRDLLDLLAWHDGSRGREVDGYYRLLSCAEILRAKKTMDDLVHEFEREWMPGDWWSRDWIPFLEFNGDLMCLDDAGRVVSFKAYSDARPVLYPSLRRWMDTNATLWAEVPEDATDDAQMEFFEGRVATRLRRKLNPGHPIARAARKRPIKKPPMNLERVRETFTRGPNEWSIEHTGAVVRTEWGRAYSRQHRDKSFSSVDAARTCSGRSASRFAMATGVGGLNGVGRAAPFGESRGTRWPWVRADRRRAGAETVHDARGARSRHRRLDVVIASGRLRPIRPWAISDRASFSSSL
jgi:hypothetical protein